MKRAPEVGDVILSRLTKRKFVVQSELVDGHHKCAPIDTKNPNDFYYISANKLSKYWEIVGKEGA